MYTFWPVRLETSSVLSINIDELLNSEECWIKKQTLNFEKALEHILYFFTPTISFSHTFFFFPQLEMKIYM